MRIRVTLPGEPNAETLGIALEAATRLAQHDVRAGRVPPIEDAIAQGIRWQPEPPGDESFDKPSTVMERGWGDCDDLAPWMAAEMRETGFDPAATAIAVPSGPRTWHAIVRGSDETLYDPSKLAGMPHNVIGQCMPCSRPLNVGRTAISVGRRGVRVDVPGLQSRRGCVIGVSHQCDCAATDEDRVVTLIQTIEEAIVTAQMARTGDPRAIKALAVIYRVLRGDDPENACADLRVQPHTVGIDFSSPAVRRFIQNAREILATAADELFAGETWTMQNGRVVKARKVAVDGMLGYAESVGFIPCLAALGPLATVATTAGTIAAVLDPIASALRELAGKDSDFGRAMATLREVLGPIKLASAIGSGVLGLATGGIPAGIQATAMRWAELMQSPLSAYGANVSKIPEVAKVLAWTERAIDSRLPRALPGQTNIATVLAPQLLDFAKTGNYEGAVKMMRDKLIKWVKEETGFTELDAATAEKMAINALKGLAEHPEPIDPPPSTPASRVPQWKTPAELAAEAEAAAVVEQSYAPVTASATQVAEIQAAEEVREQLRTVPQTIEVPEGWNPIFAMGCRQLMDACS